MTTTATAAGPAVTARYVHPQGSTIEVYDNGAVVKRGPDGKVRTTSATAAKLAAGHGGWTLVTDDAPAPAAAPAPLPPSKAAPTATLVPMKFAEAPVAALPDYVTDPLWILQQKVDGVRAQLVFEPGRKPWFRNGTGGRLANSTAAATANPILAALAPHPENAVGFTVDGEIVDQAFYAFDLVVVGTAPLSDRLTALAAWHAQVAAQGLGDKVRLLPTARTIGEKARLAQEVYLGGGEGWIAKRYDSTYTWGARVEHSLKLKITSTVDAVVTAVGANGKSNATLAAHDENGTLVEIGRASTIGKGTISKGDVVEVEYLYAGANGRLVQPRILRVRTDKPAAECSTAQLRKVNKTVVTAA